jgi:regulator of sigma E protease
MGEFLTNLVSFVVAISVLVAIHEYGHYIVGRWCGMKVLRFSIGFGKPIATWVGGKDKTEYCLSAIPLGGYVRFLDGREGDVAAEDQGRAFDHRPIPARIAVLLAGPAFNLIFAIIAYWFLTMEGVPAYRPAVGEIEPQSYAADAGLVKGDWIIAIGEKPVLNWTSALMSMIDEMSGSGSIPLTLEDQQGERRTVAIEVGEDSSRLTEPGVIFDGLGLLPGAPPAFVGSLVENGAANDASLEVGDRIVQVEEEVILGFGDLVRVVSPRAGDRVRIDYVRDSRRHTTYALLGSHEVDGEQRGLLGVGILIDDPGPVESIGLAVAKTWNTSKFTFQMLGRMITGSVSIKNISGPLSIADFAGSSAERGFSEFLEFLALVSISLGVLNLLPVPVLDGGQIVYQTVELLKGSPLSERSQILGQQFGILALILLMSFAFYNDISRILG